MIRSSESLTTSETKRNSTRQCHKAWLRLSSCRFTSLHRLKRYGFNSILGCRRSSQGNSRGGGGRGTETHRIQCREGDYFNLMYNFGILWCNMFQCPNRSHSTYRTITTHHQASGRSETLTSHLDVTCIVAAHRLCELTHQLTPPLMRSIHHMPRLPPESFLLACCHRHSPHLSLFFLYTLSLLSAPFTGRGSVIYIHPMSCGGWPCLPSFVHLLLLHSSISSKWVDKRRRQASNEQLERAHPCVTGFSEQTPAAPVGVRPIRQHQG